MRGRNLLTALWVSLGICLSAFAEDVTLTTYYPSPRGVYEELRATNNTYLATQAGNVGIGTTNPTTPSPVGAQATGNLDVHDVYLRSTGQWASSSAMHVERFLLDDNAFIPLPQYSPGNYYPESNCLAIPTQGQTREPIGFRGAEFQSFYNFVGIVPFDKAVPSGHMHQKFRAYVQGHHHSLPDETIRGGKGEVAVICSGASSIPEPMTISGSGAFNIVGTATAILGWGPTTNNYRTWLMCRSTPPASCNFSLPTRARPRSIYKLESGEYAINCPAGSILKAEEGNYEDCAALLPSPSMCELNYYECVEY
jgi:hypothetical protein